MNLYTGHVVPRNSRVLRQTFSQEETGAFSGISAIPASFFPLKFIFIQDAYHELSNEIEDIPDRVVDEIVTFVTEYNPPKAKI